MTKVRQAGRSLRSTVARWLRRVPGSSLTFGPPRREVASTLEWHRGREMRGGSGTRLQILGLRRETERRAPMHADLPIRGRFEAMRRGAIKLRFVADFSGARFWGLGYGCVIDADDALHADLSPAFSDFAPPENGGATLHDALQIPLLPKVRPLGGTVAALGTLFCENFHHWLLDAVPKFGLLRETGCALEQVDTFLLPRGATQTWHRQVFERLGIAVSKVRYTDRTTHLRVDRLVVPSYSEPGRDPERFDYTPEGLAFVRGLFLAGETRRTGAYPKKILVSRERATCRRWLGGAEDRARLGREGFITVRLEEHSLAEQAAMFQAARVIVMPAGGGLANLAFCEPGARVVELFSPAYLPTFSLALAGARELDYCALVGKSPPGAAGHSDAGGREDIDVPVERILEYVS